MVVDYSMLERLTASPDYENIIIGTGAFARDMRDKLRLLGLKATFFVSDRSDRSNDILHYNEILALDGDKKQFRFIICLDGDEVDLYGTILPVIYKYLGGAVSNHPQVIYLYAGLILLEKAGRLITDSLNCNLLLHNGRSYQVYGDIENKDALQIHFIGAPTAGGSYRFATKTMCELLQEELTGKGFAATVHSWVQPYGMVNNFGTFIRDISARKVDLLILYTGLIEQSPFRIAVRNLLSSRIGITSRQQPLITQVQSMYAGEVSAGIDHDTTLDTLRIMQQKILIAYSKLYNFTFWDVICPFFDILPEEQAVRLSGVNLRYMALQRKRIEAAKGFLDNRYTKDYRDTFNDVEDIFGIYVDFAHLSNHGCSLIAQRFAKDILETFTRRA